MIISTFISMALTIAAPAAMTSGEVVSTHSNSISVADFGAPAARISGEVVSTHSNSISVADFSAPAAMTSGEVVSTHSNFISVADFGAVADDKKDDVKAIQAALDFSRDNGLPVIYFPKGVYLIGEHLFDVEKITISSSIHVYSGQTLIFENGAILRRSKAGVSHILFSHNEADAVGYIGCHDITIIGATIDENAALGTKDTAFNFSHGERINIIGCEFYGASDWHSIEINACRNVLIDKCTFRDNINSEDIQLDAALASGNLGKDDKTVCYDIVISNCRFKSDGHYSIGNHSDAPHHDILIKDNWFSGTGVDGEYIHWVPLTHSVTVTGSHTDVK